MDPSALIFIALAVAWAAYLLPQAIKHHDRAEKTRSVQRFSGRMRVLARREPTSSTDARLVVSEPTATARPRPEGLADPVAAPVADPLTMQMPVVRPVSAAARRAAANRAARRRRTVLSAILAVLVVVAGMAAGGLFSFWWTTAPATVLVAWLVACRLTVKHERRPVAARPRIADGDDTPTVATMAPVAYEIDEETGELVAVPAEEDSSRWDMMPVTLPIYVSKPAAEQRAVSTIDLDSTGVWTSGRSEVDSEIARREEARRAQEREDQRSAERTQQRAVGS